MNPKVDRSAGPSGNSLLPIVPEVNPTFLQDDLDEWHVLQRISSFMGPAKTWKSNVTVSIAIHSPGRCASAISPSPSWVAARGFRNRRTRAATRNYVDAERHKSGDPPFCISLLTFCPERANEDRDFHHVTGKDLPWTLWTALSLCASLS